MNEFESAVRNVGGRMLSMGIDCIQVNVGLKCNQHCAHCHVEASSSRTEMMGWPVMEAVTEIASDLAVPLVDITGGAPELNCNLPGFIEKLKGTGRDVQVRTNLTVLVMPGMERVATFMREHEVRLVASLPCYLEQNVCAQRGTGVYDDSIKAMRLLNSLGYGIDGPSLDLVYNPLGAELPTSQEKLESDYRRELRERFGIEFSRLLTIANMPIGRYRRFLRERGSSEEYTSLLKSSFNKATINGLMCRHQVSVGWDGTLYDCDFNLALALPVNHGAPDHVTRFDADKLICRRIVTGEHCFGCTAGSGSSCAGSLV